MKKQKLKGLNLSKRIVSKLSDASAVKGGRSIGCETNHPNCMEPSGVSACLPCMEDFTEGCSPSFLNQCPVTTNTAPTYCW